MAALITEANLPDPDGFYEALMTMTRDLDDERARVVTAKLVLFLANHIGDMDVLRRAMELARA